IIIVIWNNIFIFFFFSSRRRHTRLQGDWSSDVCSSDLLSAANLLRKLQTMVRLYRYISDRAKRRCKGLGNSEHHFRCTGDSPSRSEERRVGKECRSRWVRDQSKKKKKMEIDDDEVT